MKAEHTLNVIGYARISDDDSGEGRGVERQREDIARYCTGRGWNLTDVIIENDRGASVYSRKHRPEFERILELLADDAIDGVVAYSIERPTRRFDQGHALMEHGRRGLHIVGIMQGIDLATDGGREVYGYMLTAAANESAIISRRVRRAQVQSLADGRKHNGSRRLFGYNSGGPGVLVINEDESPWVKEMVGLAIDGISAEGIAHHLNDNGVKTSVGNAWRGRSVKSLVANPTIAGLQSKLDGDDWKSRKVIGTGPWDAIVTPEEQAQAVATLDLRSTTAAVGTGRPGPFTGLLVCGLCGTRMIRSAARTGTTSYATWKCDRRKGGCGHNSITAACEPWILEGLFLAVRKIAVKRRQKTNRSAPRHRDVSVIRKAMARLLDVADALDDDEFDTRKTTLEAELRAAKAAQVAVTDHAAAILDAGHLDAAMWAELTERPAVQRDILRYAFGEIRVLPATRRAWNDEIATERLIFP